MLLGVITARIPSVLIRAPYRRTKSPAGNWKGGLAVIQRGEFGIVFYSTSRRTATRQNWMIAGRINPVSGRAVGLSRANSCG